MWWTRKTVNMRRKKKKVAAMNYGRVGQQFQVTFLPIDCRCIAVSV